MNFLIRDLQREESILVTSVLALISLILAVLVYDKSVYHLILFSATFTVSIVLTVYSITKVKGLELDKNGTY